MAYKIIKKNIRNSNQQEIPLKDCSIRKFCCIGEDIYFTHELGIGKISEGKIEKDWHLQLSYARGPDFSDFNSICYNEFQKCLMITSRDGCQIYKIDMFLLDFESIISDESRYKFKKKYVGDINSDSYIASLGKETVWSLKDRHRCFLLDSESARPLVGCGKSGCSTTFLKYARISQPTGIAILENSVCFADSGNNFIKSISGNRISNVVDDCKGLRDIHYKNQKLFFLSENIVYMLSSEGDVTHVFEIYEEESQIVSFCPSEKSDIYILEKYSVNKAEKNS